MADFSRSIQLDGPEEGYDGSVDVEGTQHGDLFLTTTIVNAAGTSGGTYCLEPEQAREIAGALLFGADFTDRRRALKEMRRERG